MPLFPTLDLLKDLNEVRGGHAGIAEARLLRESIIRRSNGARRSDRTLEQHVLEYLILAES
jgi:hypothetical protein